MGTSPYLNERVPRIIEDVRDLSPGQIVQLKDAGYADPSLYLLTERVKRVLVIEQIKQLGKRYTEDEIVDMLTARQDQAMKEEPELIECLRLAELPLDDLFSHLDGQFGLEPLYNRTHKQRVKRLENVKEVDSKQGNRESMTFFICLSRNWCGWDNDGPNRENPLLVNTWVIASVKSVGSDGHGFPLHMLCNSLTSSVMLWCSDRDIAAWKCTNKTMCQRLTQIVSANGYWKTRVETLIGRPTTVECNLWSDVYKRMARSSRLRDLLQHSNTALFDLLSETDIITWHYVPGYSEMVEIIESPRVRNWKYRSESIYDIFGRASLEISLKEAVGGDADRCRAILSRMTTKGMCIEYQDHVQRASDAVSEDDLKALYAEYGIRLKKSPITPF